MFLKSGYRYISTGYIYWLLEGYFWSSEGYSWLSVWYLWSAEGYSWLSKGYSWLPVGYSSHQRVILVIKGLILVICESSSFLGPLQKFPGGVVLGVWLMLGIIIGEGTDLMNVGGVLTVCDSTLPSIYWEYLYYLFHSHSRTCFSTERSSAPFVSAH